MKTLAFIALLIGTVACGGDDDGVPMDDMGTEDGDGSCSADVECGDGSFCNGVETCDPDNEFANARGCVAGADPCGGDACDEDNNRCEGGCEDADGDGSMAATCGGDDCDDTDPNRFPGNTELCNDVDEDCNPDTIGPDEDGDGFIGAMCCNGDTCGDDCAPLDPEVRPGTVDPCGNGDQDCDGEIDEGCGCMVGAVMPCGSDAAMRGLGPCREGRATCELNADGTTSFNECAGVVEPTMEICDGINNDCDSRDGELVDLTDEGCPCAVETERLCGSEIALSGVGECSSGDEICVALDGGASSEFSGCTAIEPSTEICDGLDNDCDGTVENGFGCMSGSAVTGMTACGVTGVTATCPTDCSLPSFYLDETAGTPGSCNYCDDTDPSDATDGFAAERSIAMRTVSQDFLVSTVDLYGDAEACDPPYVTPPAGVSDPCDLDNRSSEVSAAEERRIESETVLIVDSGGPGGAYLPAHTLGYGSSQFIVRTRAGARGEPEGGWAAVLLVEGATEFVGTGNLGVPSGVDGVAVEWDWGTTAAPDDIVRIRPLSTAGPRAALTPLAPPDQGQLGGNQSDQRQGFIVEITPDDPSTPADETALSVRALFAVDPLFLAECGGSAGSCGVRLRPGDPIHLGIVAGGAAATSLSTHSSTTSHLFPAAQFQGLCPG